MKVSDRIADLRRYFPFSLGETTLRTQALSLGKCVKYSTGESVLLSGSPAKHCGLILSGQAVAFKFDSNGIAKVEMNDLLPDPIFIKNSKNIQVATEKALHQLILEDIENFMRELGDSFSFIGSEYKIKIGERNHYIDFLLFNIKYNCYVVVELKVTEFKVEYISQVQKYMNYIDKNIKGVGNNKTMGILICKRENKFVIEYCSDERIAVREYRLI